MSTNEQNGNGTILMVFMFRGDYLTNELGHEIINLFKADDRKHYIYVNPWGYVNEKKYGKIDTILLVRHVKGCQVEIIAKASGLRLFQGATDRHLGHENKNYMQSLNATKAKQNNECDKIEYGGKKLVDIFGFNNPGDRQYVLVTYEAEYFRRTKRIVYIDFKDKEKIGEAGMPRRSLTTYYYPERKKGEKIYDYLRAIIDNKDYWKDEDDSQQINPQKKKNKNENILNVIGKEDDELIFSNWFCYLFRKKYSLLDSFAKDVLEISCGVGENYRVLREEDNMDIVIDDYEARRVIVIENKIKSCINGKKENCSQLDSYRNKAKEHANILGFPLDNILFFIFLPDYSAIDKKECERAGYKTVYYSKIYSFFNKIAKKSYAEDKTVRDSFDVFVLKQFVLSLVRHTSRYPDTLFEDTYKLFMEIISTVKDSEEN